MPRRYAHMSGVLAALLVVWSAGRALGDPGGPLGIHPTRLVVKYRPSLDACVDCLLQRGIPFASVTRSDSLDRLHRELGVTRARAVFASETTPLAAGRSAARRRQLDDVRRRFPARAARAPANARNPDLSAIYALQLPPGTDVAAAAARYRLDPMVEWAEPDHERRAALVPNDPFLASSATWGQSYADLWGMHVTEAPTAWDTSTGAGVVVAVIDTGVDAVHPDLAANMWTNPLEVPANGVDDDGNGFVDDVRGWDFSDGDATPNDLHGHGTHVAGTVAAVGNNSRGVVGMAWGAEVMAVRGLNANGSGFDTDLAAAMVYAAENGADVLNASWGGQGESQVLVDAVDAITALGAIMIAGSGNSASDMASFFPAAIPGVVAVGATTASDDVAFFSNYGDGLAVAAPGLDILSVRAGGIPPLGVPVGTEYMRLSGTSMATPHVAGLTAVLIGGLPGLSLADIRSHLELNADQPGYPGFEGQIWNPHFGFGRINAARVFDPPPLLAFFRTGGVEVHALADTILPDVAHPRWDFTSAAPIAWTLALPSWLDAPPGSESGSGPGEALLSADTTGLAPGRYTGDVAVDAPATDNGGAAVTATLQVHQDERVGPPTVVDPGFTNQRVMDFPPRLASDGVGTVMVWGGFDNQVHTTEILSSRIDGAGVATDPTVVDPQNEAYLVGSGNSSMIHALAFDGRNFLLVYIDGQILPGDNFITVFVKALRLDPDGRPIEGAPTILASRKRSNPYNPYAVDVGFDGEAYTVLWTQEAKPPGKGLETGERVLFVVQRLGIDGTVRGKSRRIYSRVNPIEGIDNYSPGRIACTDGSCLVAWREITLTASAPYPRHLAALQVIGDRAVQDEPVRVMNDLHNFRGLVTDGTNYLALADRLPPTGLCGTPFEQPELACPHDIVVARIGATATALDLAGIVVNNKADTAMRPAIASGVAFDGSDYVATFLAEPDIPPPYCSVLCLSRVAYQIYAARVGTDGAVLSGEIPGSMIHPERTALVDSGLVAATRSQTVIGLVTDVAGAPPSTISAQRAFARTPAVALPDLEIGAIGAQSVAERAVLAFTVRPPAGFDPEDTVVSASNLPPGAVFDASTRTFRWMPDANESGVHAAAHFEAVDGPATASEDVTITVAEGNLSLGGVLSLFGGAPVVGVTVELKGMGRPRQVVTDADGHYQFDDLVPGASLRLKLGKPTRRDYRAYPPARAVLMGTSDLSDQHFELTPAP